MSELLLWLAILALISSLVGLWRRQRRTARQLEALLASNERQREALRGQAAQSASRWQAVARATLESIIVVGPNLEIIDASPGAHALFGGDGTVVGRRLVEWTRSAELRELAAEARAQQGSEEAAAEGVSPDRVIELLGRPIRVRAAPCDEGAVLVLSDLSELHRLGRARRDFVANISHELRTPLTAIRLLLDGLLSGDLRLPQEATSTLQRIQAEAATLETMAQELVDLDQIESGKAPLRLVPVEVRLLVARAAEAVNAQLQHKLQTLSVEIPEGLQVWAATPQAARALINVLGNAVKFTPRGGHVWVVAARDGDDVRLEVRDDGIGIPPQDLERIFERFYRGDAARSGGSGTGLGLAIARHIIAAHGGRIWAQSRGIPGEGSTIVITLPAATDPA